MDIKLSNCCIDESFGTDVPVVKAGVKLLSAASFKGINRMPLNEKLSIGGE